LSGNSTGPEASAAIEIVYADAETARFILEAISPDNLPGGLHRGQGGR